MINKSKKRILPIVFCVLTAILILALCGAGILFKDELKIIGSIKSLSDESPIYYMEVRSDYHFQEFLKLGGASSDKEVSRFLTSCISKGFYSVDVEEKGPACSVISAMNYNNAHVWGRNFDWDGSVPIIVKSIPEDGYASISTCDFTNITNSSETVPDNMINKMLAIAALYVPMDGINEVGLCVADLEVNEGGMKKVDTEKSDLTITTAIRLILNKAATVEEAVELLDKYDIHASADISHHIAVSDATGVSVVIEFVDGRTVVVPTNCITNFNHANGDVTAGGVSAEERYDILCAAYGENNGILTPENIKDALVKTSKDEEKFQTQWSIVYNQETFNISYWFNRDFNTEYNFSVLE